MARSMTGYGEAESRDADAVVRVAVRSVNHKGLKINLKVDEPIASCESQVERLVRDHVSRGALDVRVVYEPVGGRLAYRVNAAAVISYYDHLREIQRQLGITGNVDLSALLALPGTLEKAEETGTVPAPLLQRILKTTSEAMTRLAQMRDQEGARLAMDVRRARDQILKRLARLEQRAPAMLAEYHERLRERVNSLLHGTDVSVSKADLCREVAIFAERCDITEEITRLRSHLQQLGETLEAAEPGGRKLEFIAQEMFREANTMASKATDPEMLRLIVEIKQEIDKIREQVMNLE